MTEYLVSVERGLYAVIPPGEDPTSYSIDPYLIAAKMASDAVLSYRTALEFYDRDYSVHNPSSSLSFREPLCFNILISINDRRGHYKFSLPV